MKPKHLKNKYFIDKGLFKDIETFNELEKRISRLPEHERGDAFEVFAEAYFATQKLSQASEVWPGEAVPSSLNNNLGLTSRDMGVDGVIHTKEGHYHAYQVKFRSGRASLSWEELSTFMGLSDRVKERVLFTNSIELPALMQDRTNFYVIKGNDLDSLDKNDFQYIEAWLSGGDFVFKRKPPLPHQVDALESILTELNHADRTSAVMACGTGKTLVSLWTAERLGGNAILILLPSLSLVRQMLHVWIKETVLEDYSFLCVCSDQSVVKGVDEIMLRQSDLNFPVTTDSESVKVFLSGKSKHKLVFSTYHSSRVVADGLPESFSFDFGVFDEAHKTAGREGTSFSFALNNDNISISKRLFLTATPRHYDVNKRNKDGEPQLVYSMDDQEVYGSISYKLSFAAAAAMGIICNYKIIISAVTEEMITRELLKRGELVVNGDIVNGNQIARALAMKNAIEKYGVKRIFTFHSSIKAAKSFTSPSGEGISAHLDGFTTFHVNGEMSTNRRESIIREFKDAPKSIMSNARCLTEGVDVPAVDMVAFMSPKKSRVDIVQAVGRAMRKPHGNDKEYGYIFLPIFLEIAKEESIEIALENTQFQDVWDILEAMQEQDDCLVEIIRQMREDIGRKKGFDDSRLRERLEFIGPELEINLLRKAITTAIVNKLSSSWDERYGELIQFKERYGHLNVWMTSNRDERLCTWVTKQRQNYKNKKQPLHYIEKLESIGFVWDPLDIAWEEMFLELCKFKEEYGHCNVKQRYPKNPKLATWVNTQRDQHKEGKCSLERVKKLEELGFVWDTNIAAWEHMLSKLYEFKEKHGHFNVQRGDLKNKRLITWMGTQRSDYKDGKLHPERQAKLEKIGFEWNANEGAWEKMYNALLQFRQEFGHCNVPPKYREKELRSWVIHQRAAYKSRKLDDRRIGRLEGIGFVLDPLNALWDETYNELLGFKKKHGHCIVPKKYSENPKLGAWVSKQRLQYSKGKLSTYRFDKLNQIAFNWNTLHSFWDEMYNELCKFKEENGHSNVPSGYKKLPKLATWISVQRNMFRKNKLSKERFELLTRLEFVFDPITTAWEAMFRELCKFKTETGHCNIAKSYSNIPGLGNWVSHQRILFKNGEQPQSRIQALENIGFNWDPYENQWEAMFTELAQFKKEHGHCNVSQKSKQNLELARWVVRQRTAYKKGLLAKERSFKLEQLEFVWNVINDAWEEMFSELLEFKNSTGHCNVPQIFPKNPKLGGWVSHQRDHYRQGILLDKRITRLQMVGFCWDPNNAIREEMFQALCAFNAAKGHCDIPSTSEFSQLARWVVRQRTAYRKGSLCLDLKKKLDALGFNWEPFANNWEEMFDVLCEFRKENGHCNVPARYQKSRKLGSWVDKQRQLYRNNQLSQIYKERLEKLGFIWNPTTDGWEEMFLKLCNFKEINGHVNISKKDNEQKLLAWLNWQRYKHKKGNLKNEFFLKLVNKGINL